MSLISKGEVVSVDKLNQKTVFIGASEPSSVYEGQLWYDTVNNVLKQRRGTSWVDVASENVSFTDVVPATDGAYSIGSGSKKWKDFYGMEIAFSNATRFKAYCSSDMSINALTWTKVNIDSVEIDSLGEFNSFYHFVCKNAGLYLIYAQATFQGLPYNSTYDAGYTGEVDVQYQTSTTICRGTTTSSSNTSTRLHTASCFTLRSLGVNDVVWMRVWHNYTSARTLKGGSDKTFLVVVRMA